jgi:hypothetical protein
LKKSSWLPWSRNDPADSQAEALKKVRRRTDQKIRQQEVQKELQEEKEKKPSSKSA